MLTDIFIVPSAIGNDYGAFNMDQRFDQLLDTLKSIKKYNPTADIIVADCSYDLIPEEKMVQLGPYIIQFFSLHGFEMIQRYRHSTLDPNRFSQKTTGEMLATLESLKFIKSLNKQYRRVFKLAGRYQLNDTFALRNYDDHKGEVVISKKQIWQGRNHYFIRLYSFDFDHLDLFTNMFDEICRYTTELIETKGVMDIIEYSIWYHLDKSGLTVIETDDLGVEGLYGQNAVLTKD
jgi:DNA primase large subunit